MNNQQIINRRWKKTERAFRSHLREVREVYRSIGDDSIDLVRSLNIRYEDLNRNVPAKVKRQVNRKIESWKKEGLLKGYFGYLVSKLKYTYSGVLEVLIYGLYMSGSKKLNTISNEIFKETAEDTYSQGLEDLNRKGKPLTWALILPFLMIPSVNLTYEQYLIVLNETGSEEMYRQILEMLKQDLDKAEEKLNDLLKKQSNRILNVNGEKESGALVDTAIGVGNDAYVLAGGGKDQLVLFVAEMDERTTDMCRSLDHQIFHTKAWNTFTRYSDYYKGKHTFTWFGLERGLNMPPITDHFHWCRSTLTYQIDMSDSDIRKNFFKDKESIVFKKLDDLDLEKSDNPSVIYEDKITAYDGRTFSGDEVKPNSDLAGESENAEWLKNRFGIDVHVMPEAKERGVKNYDYLLDNSPERWDLKAKVTGTGRRLIKNNVDYKQATSYIFDIKKTGLSVPEIEDRINYAFKSEKDLHTIIIKNGDDLVGIYRNTYKQ